MGVAHPTTPHGRAEYWNHIYLSIYHKGRAALLDGCSPEFVREALIGHDDPAAEPDPYARESLDCVVRKAADDAVKGRPPVVPFAVMEILGDYTRASS